VPVAVWLKWFCREGRALGTKARKSFSFACYRPFAGVSSGNVTSGTLLYWHTLLRTSDSRWRTYWRGVSTLEVLRPTSRNSS